MATTKIKLNCKTCGKERLLSRTIIYQKTSGNCISCSLKGNIVRRGSTCSIETKNKMSLAAMGKKKSSLHRKNISISKNGIKRPQTGGKNHYKWIHDRTKLKDDSKERGGQLHREWSKQVKNRDKWICRIADTNCDGKLEAHHILGWTAYPELRYEVNNGITLCHFHHPRKRNDEMRLSPYFQELVKE